MAIVKTQAVDGKGVNFSLLDIRVLATYQQWEATPASLRLHDATDSNYVQFGGKGLAFQTNGSTIEDVLGGTVNSLDIGFAGINQIAITDLKLTAKTLFDQFATADAKGAWEYLFSGNDKISGTKYADYLLGGAGNDTVSGGGGKDVLEGNAGNDKLYGGAGADKLIGGSGADTFIFKSIADSTVSAGGRDTIVDFNPAEQDRIDLKAIDASSKLAGDQAFTFIGDDAFHKVAGELRYQHKNGDTFVYGDIDGNGKADFSILIDGTIDLKAGDFIL